MKKTTSTIISTKALIVNYHYCTPKNGWHFSGLDGVTPQVFNRQIKLLQNNYEAISPEVMPFKNINSSSEIGYMVTFDDGTKDIYEYAIPFLKKYHISALFFCCSAPYLEGRVLNVQKTHLLKGKWGWNVFQKRFLSALNDFSESWRPEDTRKLGIAKMYRYDNEKTANFKRLINTELDYSLLDKVLDQLFEAEFGPQYEVVKYLYMSVDELKYCRDSGLSIGLHSHSHKFMSRLTAVEQDREFSQSFNFFSDILDTDINSFSYPYGITGSWNDTTKSIIKKYNLRSAYTLERELYNPSCHVDPFTIPRFDVNDIFPNKTEINVSALI